VTFASVFEDADVLVPRLMAGDAASRILLVGKPDNSSATPFMPLDNGTEMVMLTAPPAQFGALAIPPVLEPLPAALESPDVSVV
jgi:hypothetical protein